jgi:hypothetical protein
MIPGNLSVVYAYRKYHDANGNRMITLVGTVAVGVVRIRNKNWYFAPDEWNNYAEQYDIALLSQIEFDRRYSLTQIR